MSTHPGWKARADAVVSSEQMTQTEQASWRLLTDTDRASVMVLSQLTGRSAMEVFRTVMEEFGGDISAFADSNAEVQRLVKRMNGQEEQQ